MIWRPTPAHSTRRLSRHRAPVSWRMIDDTDGLLNGDPYVMRTRASAMLPSVQTASYSWLSVLDLYRPSTCTVHY
jgi:hypothetical protein